MYTRSLLYLSTSLCMYVFLYIHRMLTLPFPYICMFMDVGFIKKREDQIKYLNIHIKKNLYHILSRTFLTILFYWDHFGPDPYCRTRTALASVNSRVASPSRPANRATQPRTGPDRTSFRRRPSGGHCILPCSRAPPAD